MLSGNLATKGRLNSRGCMNIAKKAKIILQKTFVEFLNMHVCIFTLVNKRSTQILKTTWILKRPVTSIEVDNPDSKVNRSSFVSV